MRVKVTTGDGKTELGQLEIDAKVDVIVWDGRFFILAGDGLYREAFVAFVRDDKKIGQDKGISA